MTRTDLDRRALELFARVCDLPDDERRGVLDAECGSDSELRELVHAMIIGDAAADGPIPKGDFGVGAGVLARGIAAVDDDVGGTPSTIGRYRVVREIGRGGMGVVYEAEQDHPRRRVAIKVVRHEFVSRSTLRRFGHEVQALGRLDHPGIAHIYEAGSARIGETIWPFFAMEYVDGLPLDEHAKSRGLGRRQIVELVCSVCDAVQHAHQREVIHRDLKPANIIVRERAASSGDSEAGTSSEPGARPKILDFGVARLSDPDRQQTTIQTGIGQIIGTLAYMSPEQFDGDPASIDTRCDIYAIGVVLFQLLAGELPHELSGASLAEGARVVRHEEPQKLGRFDPSLRGDLETIVEKAMAKDPERRYVSAAALGDDLRRYLTNEPISARPASAIYKFRKFARRNSAVVVGAAAVLATMVVGSVVSTWFAVGEHRAGIELQRLAARASVAAAASALREGDIATAVRYLDEVPPDGRTWIWEHLSAQTDESLLSAPFRPEDGPADPTLRAWGKMSIWFDEPGDRVFVQLRRETARCDVFETSTLERIATAESPSAHRFIPVTASELIEQEGTTETGRHRIDLPVSNELPLGRTSARLVVDRAGVMRRLSQVGLGSGGAARSPDGRWIAGANGFPDPPTIGVISTDDESSLVDLGLQQEGISSMVFSPDGRLLIVAGFNRQLRCFDINNGGTVLWEVDDAHSDAILSVDHSPTDDILVSGGQDGIVRFWESTSGQLLDERVGHSSAVLEVVFAPDGGRAISAQADRVFLWDAPPTPDPSVVWSHSWFVQHLSISRDGTMLAAAANDALTLWDVSSGGELLRVQLTDATDLLAGIAFDHTHYRFWWTTDAGGLHSVDLRTGERWDSPDPLADVLQVITSREEHPTDVSVMAVFDLAPAAEMVVSADRHRGMYLMTSERGIQRGNLNDPRARTVVVDGVPAWLIQILPNGERFLLARDGTSLEIIDAMQGTVLASHDGYGRQIISIAHLEQRGLLVTGASEREIRLWDDETLTPAGDLRGHLDSVQDLVSSLDGRTIFSASHDYSVRRWDTRPIGEILLERKEWQDAAESSRLLDDATLRRRAGDPSLTLLENRAALQVLAARSIESALQK